MSIQYNKNSFYIKLVILVFLSFILAGCSSGIKELKGKAIKAPATRLTMLSGEYRSLSSFRTKKLVLLFWASWCSRSKGAVSVLNSLATSPSATKQAHFVAVSVDRMKDESKMKRFINNGAFKSLQYAFSGNDFYDEAYIAFDIEEIPALYVIDEQGDLILITGSVSDVKDLLK